MKLLLLNGVNMNMLGRRDVALYGSDTLDELENKVRRYAASLGIEVECRQHNCEGALVEELQNTKADGVILNAGAYSHYSIALRDCIECISVPVAEVHMTDISKREPFRRTDVLKEVCAGYFCGKGIESYMEAVRFFAK